MIVNAQDLLQPSSSDTNIVSSSSSAASGFGVADGFDPLAFLARPETFNSFIIGLNYFTLGWCIFYSILFVTDFFYHRMYFNEGEIPKEELGVSSIRKAAKIWWTYLVCWVFLVLYSIFPAVGLVTIIVYFAKIVIADLPVVLNAIHDNVGFNGIFKNYKNLVAPIVNLLTLNVKKKKK